MNKYLIFRTDRIGDFLISLVLIKSIKEQDVNSHITVVTSEKNFEFIKSFNIINDVIVLKDGFLNKIKLILSLRNNIFDFIIAHDGKKRSKLISFFLKSKKKYFSYIKNFSSYIDEINHILNYLKLNINDIVLDTLENRDYSKFNTPKNPYILVHFDEKWIFDQYIQSYSNIEPTLNELENFLNSLSAKTKYKIIISTGINTPIILNKFFKNNINENITLYENLSFLDLEALISNSLLLISCHGAVSHVAASKKIKQIDIIDKSYNYKKWTHHFRNYKSLERKNFDILYKEILSLIN